MPTDQESTPILTPTPASEWGKTASADQGFVVELPSGSYARVRRTMSILRVVQEGHIPNPLRGVVMGMISSGDTGIPTKAAEDPKFMGQFADFLDMIAVETMIEPPVDRPTPRGKVKEKGEYVNPDETNEEYYERIEDWVPKKDHISVFQLDIQDKMFLLLTAQGAALDAKSFREFQAESLASVEDVKKSPKPTKRTGGSGTRKSKS